MTEETVPLTLAEWGRILAALDSAYRSVGGTRVDGKPVQTTLSEARADLLHAYTLRYYSCEATDDGLDPTATNPVCGQPAVICNPIGKSGADPQLDYDEWFCREHAPEEWFR